MKTIWYVSGNLDAWTTAATTRPTFRIFAPVRMKKAVRLNHKEGVALAFRYY